MACQKVYKQGRDDIIVKVNLQSPIPTSFCTVNNFYKLMFFKSFISYVVFSCVHFHLWYG